MLTGSMSIMTGQAMYEPVEYTEPGCMIAARPVTEMEEQFK